MSVSRDDDEAIAAATPTPDSSVPRVGGKAALDATLATGEAELAAGKTAEARTRLESLEKQAKEKGFLLFAKKASTPLGAR